MHRVYGGGSNLLWRGIKGIAVENLFGRSTGRFGQFLGQRDCTVFLFAAGFFVDRLALGTGFLVAGSYAATGFFATGVFLGAGFMVTGLFFVMGFLLMTG
jgi:hypothetical protein